MYCMKKDIYICTSYYHLLITLSKCIKAKNQNDLLISADFYDNKLINDKELINRIMKYNMFDKVYFFDYSEEQIKFSKSIFKYFKYFLLIKKADRECKIDFKSYNNVYIYNDVILLGKILNYRKTYYRLIEDGTDCFKNNSRYWKKQNPILKFIKNKIFGIYEIGKSKYVKSIEVNNKVGVELDNKEIIEVSKEKIFESLTKEEKMNLFNIFLDKIDTTNYKNCSILITQPFLEDNKFNNEHEQIELYKYIVNKYLTDDKIIIKTHPREQTNYKKYFENTIIIDKPFPIEVFNFCEELEFNKCITVSSTAIESLNRIKEKIYLGWTWLEEYKKGKYNG